MERRKSRLALGGLGLGLGLALALAAAAGPALADEDQTYDLDNLISNPAGHTRPASIHAVIRKTGQGLLMRQEACGWTCASPVYLPALPSPASLPGGRLFFACLDKAWAGGDDFDGYVIVRIVRPPGQPHGFGGVTLVSATQGQIVAPADGSPVADCGAFH